MRKLTAVFSSIAALAAAASCPALADARIDLPIKQLVLPNNNIRYSVPVTVGGGTPIEATLDTGSFGLRVLSSAVRQDQYQATDVQRDRVFGAGVRLQGFIANATLGFGGAQTERPVRIQVVSSVECVESRPDCPAAKMKPDEYRMAGDGFAGRGFEAILGISMRHPISAEAAENPLLLVGDKSWIVVLPRPGDSAPGHLILNPTAEDRAGFAIIRLQPQGEDGTPGWADGALAGCVIDKATKQKLCGKTLLDTGGPGFSVDSEKSTGRSRWKAGTPAKLEIQGSESPIEIDFKAGADPADRVTVHPPRNPSVPRISAGTLPYFHYAVLYDAKAGVMGFRRRNADGP